MDPSNPKKFLNVGSGPKENVFLPPWLKSSDWQQVRLDIEPANDPDILCSATDMSAHVADASFDAIWAANILEHLYAHDVEPTVRELVRVIKPDGIVQVLVPDLQRVASMVAQGKLLETVYLAPSGPISPIDILFGHRGSIAQGEVHMAHKTGFIESSLHQLLHAAGLKNTRIYFLEWDLLAVGTRSDLVANPLLGQIDECCRAPAPAEKPERKP